MSNYTDREWKTEDNNFIYALNKRGTNLFSCHIQRGRNDDGGRTTDDDIADVTRLLKAAPALLEALKKAVAWMDDRREIAEYVPEIAESLNAISQAEGKE